MLSPVILPCERFTLGDFMGLLQSIRAMIGASATSSTPVTNAERRRYRRIQGVKLTILTGDHRYKTKDWSLGGFRIQAPELQLRTNDYISGAIHGPGLFNRGTFDGHVAWVAESGELGVRFSEVSRETFMAMSAAQSKALS